MRQEIQEFLDYLDSLTETDYGDFKRKADLHLMHMIASQRHLSEEQVKRLKQLRQELLWTPHGDDDIPKVRDELKTMAEHL